MMTKPSNLIPANNYTWDTPSKALEVWAEVGLAPSNKSDPSVIDIYEVIGEDYWTGGGFTEAKLAAILRERGEGDVTLNINSPGGDAFAGIAMFNRLRRHSGKVTVNIIGIAASAASVIAMAGDEIVMDTGAIMMIHNAWGLVIGNRHDFAEAAKIFETYDKSLASIYSERTGIELSGIMAMMDGEADGTYFTADEAVENKFADSKNEIEVKNNPANKLPDSVISTRRIEAALAKDGVSRKERGDHLKNLTGLREAPAKIEREADDDGELIAALTGAMSTLKA